MSAAMELALLALHRAVGEFVEGAAEDMSLEQLEQLLPPDRRRPVTESTPTEALSLAASAADFDRPEDRFAAAQAFFLGARLPRVEGVEEELRGLAAALVRSGGSAEPANGARVLVDTVSTLSPGEPVTEEVIDGLRSAFAPALRIAGDPTGTQVRFSGPAARLALLILEFFTNGISCRLEVHEIDIAGHLKPVILVEVDVCTNLPFEHCKRGIDPREWPKYNPYFLSVRVLGPVNWLSDGWAGVIKEEVGCPFNGTVYKTDLAIRCVNQPGLAAVAFDLAPIRNDDGRVSVDRGFLSATDEGLHRRIRVEKVYRIEDLKIPQRWLCPLWASQVAMAAWWRL